MTKRAKGTLALILAFVVLANAGIFWKMSYSKTHTSGDTIVVRVGDTVAANHPISQALYIFEEELERISNGRFDVRVYINSALGGAGGLGDFAVRYGHDRNMADVTNVTVLVLVIIVCIIEFVGGRVVKKNTH